MSLIRPRLSGTEHIAACRRDQPVPGQRRRRQAQALAAAFLSGFLELLKPSRTGVTERAKPAPGQQNIGQKAKGDKMTYQVQFHWDRWEVVKEPDHRVMRQCKSLEEADRYAAKLSTYDELMAQLDQVLALSVVPLGFREAEGAAA